MPRKGPGAKPGSLGARLAGYMTSKGMSAADVAKIAGLSTDGVRNIATGRAPSPRAATIQAIAAALDINTTDLMQPPTAGGQPAIRAPDDAPPGWVDVPQVDIFEMDAASLASLPPEGYWRMPESLLTARRVKPENAFIVRLQADESPAHRQGDYFLVDTAPMIGPPRRGGWVVVQMKSFGLMLAEYKRSTEGHWDFTLQDGEGVEIEPEQVKLVGLLRGKMLS